MGTQRHEPIGDAERRAFEDIGAIVVPGLIETPWLETLAATADVLREELGDQGKGGCFGTNVWRTQDPVRRFMYESPVAETAAALLDADEIRLYEDLFIHRDAGSQGVTDWHQDEVQWPLTGSRMCSVWFSTDATTAATGALRFVPGSHRGPTYTPKMPPGREQYGQIFEAGDIPDVDADPDTFPVLSFDTQPGDAVVFHPRMLHGAFGSSSDHPRRTFSFRCVGEDTRWTHKDHVYLDFLRELPLRDGDPLPEEHFPLLWTRQLASRSSD